MLQYLEIGLIFIVLALLGWGLHPYFRWHYLSRQAVPELTVVTKEGREPLDEYLAKRRREETKIHYTIVVPTYNEAKRLPNMLPVTIEHFERMNYKYEIIIANDSSIDKTTEVALSYSDYNGKKVDIKVIEYQLNQGKGGAVRIGCLAASGEAILMVDADGASDIHEFEKLVEKLREIEKDGHAIAAGSRRLYDDECTQDRAIYRRILSKCSNFVVQKICGVKLRDTQCGFKLFTKKTAHTVFKPLHIRKWAFDVEIFVVANMLGVPYAEVPINYTDQEDSKLNVITDSLQMARDFILIRFFHLVGLWHTNHSDKLWEKFCSHLPEEIVKNRSPKHVKIM